MNLFLILKNFDFRIHWNKHLLNHATGVISKDGAEH